MPEGMSPGQASLGSHRAFQEAHLSVMSKDKLSYLEPGKQCRSPKAECGVQGQALSFEFSIKCFLGKLGSNIRLMIHSLIE